MEHAGDIVSQSNQFDGGFGERDIPRFKSFVGPPSKRDESQFDDWLVREFRHLNSEEPRDQTD